MKKFDWTKPYFGVSHYGVSGPEKHWLTVIERESSCDLIKWFPGCAFSPIQEIFKNASDAKKAGVDWLSQQFNTSPK